MESFMIAAKYVPKNELQQVAKAVLLAQKIKEESWNGKSYNKDHFRAAKKAIKSLSLNKFWVDVICGWNSFMWNDVQWWAKEILKS